MVHKATVTLNVIGFHPCHKSVREISALLDVPTASAIIVKRNRLGATTARPRSVRPCKLTERGRRVLKRVALRNRLSSAVSLTTEYQTASGSTISTRTLRRELHGMGFHGRSAAHKPHITMCNAKRWLEWCKARRNWTLE